MAANATSVAARLRLEPSPATGVSGELCQLLGRAVPPTARLVLLTAALAALLLLAWSTYVDSNGRSALADASHRLELMASLAAYKLAAPGKPDLPVPSRVGPVLESLSRGGETGWRLFLFDADGLIEAAEPPMSSRPRVLADLLADAEPLSSTRRGTVLLAIGGRTKDLIALRRIGSHHLAVVLSNRPVQEAVAARMRRDAAVGLAILLCLGGLGFACVRSLSRARRSETLLRQANGRMEASLGRGRCGLWDWDIAGDRIVWSASMYALLGYEPREHLSVGELKAIIDPAETKLYGLALATADGGPTYLDHEFRVRTAAGTWMWLRARAELVVDPADRRPHLVGIAVDVTAEREQAERDATAELRLRDALEAISEAFVLWDADDRLVLCNSRFRDLHSLPLDKAQPGLRLADVASAGGAMVAGELLLRERTVDAQLPDGRWLHVSERRTRDGGFVAVGTDITALKRHEQKLVASERRLRASLKHEKKLKREADIQSHELAELAERYHEERDRAELASRAKTEFLAKMSHELRTPLNAIIGFADFMQHQVYGPLGHPRYAEYLGYIQGSGHDLLQMIDRILQMSRIDSGRLSLTPSVVDVMALVNDVVRELAPLAAGKGLELSADLRGAEPIIADPSAIRQVVGQILGNAISFTPNGGRVAVRVRSAGEGVNVFVGDQGGGIPADFLHRLGTPFEQVDPEYHRAAKGCGLGLPIAKALTRMHGGGLRIRSQEGVGTVVLVHLPIDMAANDRGALRDLEAAE